MCCLTVLIRRMSSAIADLYILIVASSGEMLASICVGRKVYVRYMLLPKGETAHLFSHCRQALQTKITGSV